jgi:hypothetical protein
LRRKAFRGLAPVKGRFGIQRADLHWFAGYSGVGPEWHLDRRRACLYDDLDDALAERKALQMGGGAVSVLSL